jgi:hypothetical protein
MVISLSLSLFLHLSIHLSIYLPICSPICISLSVQVLGSKQAWERVLCLPPRNAAKFLTAHGMSMVLNVCFIQNKQPPFLHVAFVASHDCTSILCFYHVTCRNPTYLLLFSCCLSKNKSTPAHTCRGSPGRSTYCSCVPHGEAA